MDPPSPPAPVGITVCPASPESQLSPNLESVALPPMLLLSRNLEESSPPAPAPPLISSYAPPHKPLPSPESEAPQPPPPSLIYTYASPHKPASKGSAALVGGLVVAGVAVLVAAALVYFLRIRRRREGKELPLSGSPTVSVSTMEKNGKEGNKLRSSPLQSHTTPASHGVLQLQESQLHSKTQTSTTTTSSSVSTGDYVQLTIEHVGVRTFTNEELSIATNEFSQDNFLGRGGFGSVYKGILPGDGVGVAIKQLKAGSFQGEREFLTEINVISRVHHMNLVTLVGYCVSGPERLLVYEYIENNNLAFHLQGKETPLLDWETRMSIALGAAKGIAYLHEECHPKIIHRDIKSTNILLDANFKAKVADFGLAKFVSDDITYVSTRIMGTFGYLAPDYGSSGRLTVKSDVFSFGVVLLELITGRQPIDLVEWASLLLDQALEGGKFDTELVDPELADNYDYEEMNRMVTCAAICVHRFPDYRPRMSQVVQALEGNISLEKLKADTRRPRTRRST